MVTLKTSPGFHLQLYRHVTDAIAQQGSKRLISCYPCTCECH